MICSKTKTPITSVCRLKPLEPKEPETAYNCPHVIFDCYQPPNNKPAIEELRLKAMELLPKYFNCALIAAQQGGMTLEEIGNVMGITRERVRQIENNAIERIAYGNKLTGKNKETLSDGFTLKKRGKRYQMLKEAL